MDDTNPNVEETETEDPVTVAPGGMSEMEKRLFNIRMKMNQARKANKQETIAEFNRFKDPKYDAKQRYHEKQMEARAENAKKAVGGVNNEESSAGRTKESIAARKAADEMMHMTASMAEQKKEKLEQKANSAATFGWQAFTKEADFRAYEKQLKKLSANTTSTSSSSSLVVDNTVTDSTELLNYGKAGAKVSQAGIDRLSKDLAERDEARKKNSRRRMHIDGTDVDSINAKNEFFNKKIKRSFDKYTVEIRQNLERGTAI